MFEITINILNLLDLYKFNGEIHEHPLTQLSSLFMVAKTNPFYSIKTREKQHKNIMNGEKANTKNGIITKIFLLDSFLIPKFITYF